MKYIHPRVAELLGKLFKPFLFVSGHDDAHELCALAPPRDLLREPRLLEYMNRLAKEKGLPELKGTSIQLTKNMRTKFHRDRNNRGCSYITALGNFIDGETFVAFPTGSDRIVLQEDIKGFGLTGKSVRGSDRQILSLLRFSCLCLEAHGTSQLLATGLLSLLAVGVTHVRPFGETFSVGL